MDHYWITLVNVQVCQKILQNITNNKHKKKILLCGNKISKDFRYLMILINCNSIKILNKKIKIKPLSKMKFNKLTTKIKISNNNFIKKKKIHIQISL